jgi:type I restriction enzyme, R subunit
MVICIDNVTAVKMYDKVQKYWKAYRGSLARQLAALPSASLPTSKGNISGNPDGYVLAAEWQRDFHADQRRELKRNLAFMDETDIAVIVSQ